VNVARRAVTYDHVKRGLDLIGGLLAFAVSLPVQGAVAIAVARKLGRPVLFRQQRPGRDGRVFTLVKFRTMKDPDPVRGLVTDEQRLTPFGARLRATSLDELPTMINVIKGDMSIVGPRPLLVSYLTRYSTLQARRHEVRPGVTGLAQVSGRNSISWDEKLALDVEYVDTRSFRLDARILVRTLTSLLSRDGISADGHVTAHEFMGGANEGLSEV
jgi:lipopolysaccharide/colanic/teichoic acid biosynthesis glycosyltransferase